MISFVDALSVYFFGEKPYVLISGELKNMLALSFDRDFRALGLTIVLAIFIALGTVFCA